MRLSYTFEGCEGGVSLRFRTSGRVFSLGRFNTHSKCLIQDLLSTDDVDFIVHSEEDLQLLIDCFSIAYDTFELRINLRKMKSDVHPST